MQYLYTLYGLELCNILLVTDEGKPVPLFLLNAGPGNVHVSVSFFSVSWLKVKI